MGMSQMCTGAGDYFRTSKPHSEKLCHAFSELTRYSYSYLDLFRKSNMRKITILSTIQLMLIMCIFTISIRNIANLNFFAELLTFYLHKGSRHSFHVRVRTFKGDPPASDRVFVLVCVDSRIHYAWLGRVVSVTPPVYKATAFSASEDSVTSK